MAVPMIKSFLVLLALLIVSLQFAAAEGEFCFDSDSGVDPFTPGITSYGNSGSSGGDWDECSVEKSGTLVEWSCSGASASIQQINCNDFGAVCVNVNGPSDYCACPEGTTFNENIRSCERQIPEFSALGIILAVTGSLGFLLLIRKS